MKGRLMATGRGGGAAAACGGARAGGALAEEWGPYLSERQWGTIREDYSDNGDAWSYFSHDQARSRAYRWGEDGLAGISDDRQLLCFALALWNGKDPILKERLFGLTNSEGNHGEDYEYFHGDNGAGLGASHQTGWTGIVARAMHLFATTTPEQMLELGKGAGASVLEPAPSGRTGGAPSGRRR
jgi:hypothetical protein